VLAGEIGAAEGGELGVAHFRSDGVGVDRRHRAVFGVAAVAAVADIVDVGQAVVVSVVEAEVHHDSPP
jgi:hypothetical protein